MTLLAKITTVDIVPLEDCFITYEFIGISQIKNNNILYKFYQSAHISAFLVFMAVNKAKPYNNIMIRQKTGKLKRSLTYYLRSGLFVMDHIKIILPNVPF